MNDIVNLQTFGSVFVPLLVMAPPGVLQLVTGSEQEQLPRLCQCRRLAWSR